MRKRELASEIEVTERSVSAYESGDQEPESATLKRISAALRFPEAFFYGDEPEIPTPDVASFRSLSKITAAQRDSALGAGAIALLLNRWIEEKFELPESDMIDLGREMPKSDFDGAEPGEIEDVAYPKPGATDNPEAAADMLRAHWGLGEQPIKNVIGLIESKGVRVYSLAIDAKEVDAFSMWSAGRPFMFLNTAKSAEHCRFDAAHELGHLILHRHAQPQGPDLEREANSFASAFLMPRGSVLAMPPHSPSLSSLIKYKRHWGVSVAALNYRLHALHLTSDWTYRTLCIHIAQAGYRATEPEPMVHEKSIILEMVFGYLRDEGTSKAAIADLLSIPVQEIEELTFGLMLNILKGGVGPKSAAARSTAARLRLVKG